MRNGVLIWTEELTGDREGPTTCTSLGIYETNHDNPRTHHLQPTRLFSTLPVPLFVHYLYMGCNAFQYITNGDSRLCYFAICFVLLFCLLSVEFGLHLHNNR